MKKIDFHVHCNIGSRADVEKLAAMARSTDSLMALSGGLRYGAVDYLPNEQVLEICGRYPDVFLPLAKADLWETADASEIARWKELKFAGVKFIYPYHPYDHDLYMPVYAACEKYDLPVLFHTDLFRADEADALHQRPTLRNMHPITLDRIARSFPRLKIVMAHLGSSIFREEAAELVRAHANLYADLAGCGNWLALSPEKLDALLAPGPRVFSRSNIFAGYEKLIFGSDSYVSMPEIHKEAMNCYENLLFTNGVPAEVREKVMGKTVAGWLGIELRH